MVKGSSAAPERDFLRLCRNTNRKARASRTQATTPPTLPAMVALFDLWGDTGDVDVADATVKSGLSEGSEHLSWIPKNKMCLAVIVENEFVGKGTMALKIVEPPISQY